MYIRNPTVEQGYVFDNCAVKMPTPRYDLRAPLPPPTPPEFVYCTERLGVDLNPDDCYVAAEPMLDAPSAMGYFTDEPRLGFDLAELPYRNSHG